MGMDVKNCQEVIVKKQIDNNFPWSVFDHRHDVRMFKTLQ